MMDNIIKYGDGKQVEYSIRTVFVLDYGEIDDIIETEFPFLNWQGIIAEEELTNYSMKEIGDVGPPEYDLDKRDVEEILAGTRPMFCNIHRIFSALYMRDVIPSGDYLIRIFW